MKSIFTLFLVIGIAISGQAQQCMGVGSGWNSLAGNNASCGKFLGRGDQSKFSNKVLIAPGDTNRVWLNDTSAYLQIDGTGGGVLIPRMSSSQMNAIISPATGLIIYNTSVNAIHWYDGSSWNSIGGGVNIYNANGTLTGDRILDGNAGAYALRLNNLHRFRVKATNASEIVCEDTLTLRSDTAAFVASDDGLNLLFGGMEDLRINGSAGTSGYVLTTNGAGVPPTWSAAGGSGSYTFSNGLTETGGAVKLGGNLSASTSLNLSNNTLLNYGKYGNFRLGNDTLFASTIPTIGFYKPISGTLNAAIGFRNTSGFGQDSISMTFGYENLAGGRATRLYLQPVTGDGFLDATRDLRIKADRDLILNASRNGSINASYIASVYGQTGTFEAGFFKFWETLTPNIVVSNIYTGKLGNGGLITDWNSWYCKTDTSTGVTKSGMYQLTTPATDSSTSNRHIIEIEKDSFVIAFNANSSSNGGLRFVTKNSGWSFNRDSADVVKISPTGQLTTLGFQLPTGAGLGKVLTSDGTGIGTWQALDLQQAYDNGDGYISGHGGGSFILDSFSTVQISKAGKTALTVNAENLSVAMGDDVGSYNETALTLQDELALIRLFNPNGLNYSKAQTISNETDTIIQVVGSDTLFTVWNADSARWEMNSTAPISMNGVIAYPNGNVVLPILRQFADDTAAGGASPPVPVGGLYKDSVVKYLRQRE